MCRGPLKWNVVCRNDFFSLNTADLRSNYKLGARFPIPTAAVRRTCHRPGINIWDQPSQRQRFTTSRPVNIFSRDSPPADPSTSSGEINNTPSRQHLRRDPIPVRTIPRPEEPSNRDLFYKKRTQKPSGRDSQYKRHGAHFEGYLSPFHSPSYSLSLSSTLRHLLIIINK